tara:strand:+ start:2286 stop:2654 length:369 start_codon:yes stop_codon:yes gene_type:complete
MDNVILGNLYLDKHQNNLILVISNMMRNNQKLKEMVDTALIQHISVENKKKRTNLQTKLFKKGMVGLRRDFSTDLAVKILTERLVRIFRFIKYNFNTPTYNKKTYERISKIREISCCRIKIN